MMVGTPVSEKTDHVEIVIMNHRRRVALRLVFYFGFLVTAGSSHAPVLGEPIHMPRQPHLSPDGKRLAFEWAGDLWTVSSGGGTATRLTHVDSNESDPHFSPDGTKIAFTSDRTGSPQVYVMPATGGEPTQLTYHTEGSRVAGWYPDGQSLLIRGQRDHYWHHAERFFQIDANQRSTERLLFNALGSSPSLSPNGSQILFNREGERWWRKGYTGSRAAQVWLYDTKTRKFRELVRRESESRSPVWQGPTGKSFVYVSGQDGALNLYQRDLDSGEEKQLTNYDDDSALWPTVSRDGSTIVYRHLFDLYRIDKKNAIPQKIEIQMTGDSGYQDRLRRTLTTATDVSFTKDGLEIAFIAGGDIWVMDTVLKEPRQVTNTVEFERDIAFSPDGKSLLYVSDRNGQSDVWVATRGDEKLYWWQNESFQHKQLTDDSAVESRVSWSPQGDQIAYVHGLGTLRIAKLDGSQSRDLVESWNRPSYDWSPDGKWMVYSLSDSQFNRDIYVAPIDGSREPFNLSRHPDNEFSPTWSPDGKMIAFVGRREGQEVDIYYVVLSQEEDQISSRDRQLNAALEKINKVRRKTTPAAKTPPTVKIDFEGIFERIRRISIEDTSESAPFWSPDSKRLAFQAKYNGKEGTYVLAIPGSPMPSLLTTTTGSHARWLAAGNTIVWLVKGKPASHTATGAAATYSFTVRQEMSQSQRHVAVFDDCWRAMRDNFYDERLNNRNWDAIRRKYQDAAAAARSTSMLADVVHMMLGELNASHLGFSTGSSRPTIAWRETTAHLGVRFDPRHRGPGLKVKNVLPKSPATQVKSHLEPGDIILEIDGTAVDPAMDLTTVLNVVLPCDMKLKVQKATPQEMSDVDTQQEKKQASGDLDEDKQETDAQVVELIIRPTTFGSARSALYEKWIDDNQRAVAKASDGKLAYMHIRGMNMTSFYRFERELFEVASGKDGIVIDVRENGGGSTADHLLTILTQPVHAITVPRGGTLGYPQDRKVYATWRKPIVVLCNQNSFSNAEIFSHAIKTLKRGKVIGVTTAGGVISTGSARIMDVGMLRMPFRGWFVLDTGEDMELNGAVPHQIVWPEPGQMPAGVDKQLARAIKTLKADVKRWRNRPRPELRKASERTGE